MVIFILFSPWLNVFLDSVIGGMDRERRGVRMKLDNDEWWVNVLLFADDAAIVADTEEELCYLVKQFERMCDDKGLKINPGKSKVMKLRKLIEEEQWVGHVELGGELLESVDVFRYLGMDIEEGGGVMTEVNHRLNEGAKVLGGLRKLWGKGNLSREVKVKLFESVWVPSVMYGSGSWVLSNKVRKRVEVAEMKGLRFICGIRRLDKVRNVRVREMCGWKKSAVERVEHNGLKWFEHVCRMDNERLAKRVWLSEMEGIKGRGRPKLRCQGCLRWG